MSIIHVIKKFRRLLSAHQKLRILELAVLMVLGGLLEMCSVSLMLPFVEAVMNPEEIMSKSYVRWICELLGITSARIFLMLAAVLLALIYICKNVYLIFQYNIQQRFVFGNMFSMQLSILKNFISRPYEFFLRINSGEVIRIVNNDTSQVFGMLSTLLNLFTELVVSAMLIVTVFVISPVVTVLMAVILLAMLLVINRVLKPILRRAGIANQQAAAGMNKWMIQAVQGIKELKVMQKEQFFEDNYDRYGRSYVNTMRRNNILNSLPRFLIEGVSMAAMFIAVAIVIYNGSELETIVPILSAVAMAALRLLPSVNRISSCIASISYSEPMLDKVLEILGGIDEENRQGAEHADAVHTSGGGAEKTTDSNAGSQRAVEKSGESADEYVKRTSHNLRTGLTEQTSHNLQTGLTEQTSHNLRTGLTEQTSHNLRTGLSFDRVSYHYPDVEKNVLSEASFVIRRGESVGIVGSSGSGKTTTVDLLLGLLYHQEGCISIDGMDIREDIHGWLDQIGYIPQTIFMLDDTIRANVAFGIAGSEVSEEEVWKALRDAALEEFVRELPEGLNTQIGERGVRLSGGQKQRIGIARALYNNPDVLIFDEATSALDNETESAIMESIYQLQGQKTMIIIAHRLTTIERCDHIFRVEGGKITREK